MISRIWQEILYFNSICMCSEAFQLSQQQLLTSPEIHQRLNHLHSKEFLKTLASDAAGEAIAAGRLEDAVTMLERGRGLLLGSLGIFRTPFDALRLENEDLAERIQALAVELDCLQKPGTSAQIIHAEAGERRDRLLSTQRRLMEQWEQALNEVRGLSGFEKILLPLSYRELQRAAASGPVVIVNACLSRCDALIIQQEGPPTLVPLQDASYEELASLYNKLSKYKELKGGYHVKEILNSLWNLVVSPIASGLSQLGLKHGQRIWWCPSTAFTILPLHAAGPYIADHQNFPDLYISSYTPTLRALITAREHQSHESLKLSADPETLLVGNEGSQELGVLDIEKEFAAIEGVAGLSSSRMSGKDALPDRVLSAMVKRPWVHISCHGLLDQMQPTESYFQLDGGEKLMVSEIIKFRFPNAELAFLLACHTASGGIVLIDEALHLASAFQFAGFKSIIGTMWEMWDDEAPELARDFYSYLMDHGGSYRNSAHALAYAIKQMRKRGSHPGRWAMLIHTGV